MNFLGKLLSLLVLILVITFGIWIFVKGRANAPSVPVATSAASGNSTKVEVTKTDIAQNGVSSLPAGFPTDIPVETNNITESYRVAYKDKGIVQYTLSYTSLKTRDALWSAYSSYMSGADFAVDKSASSKSLGQISGTKGTDTLSVVISDHSGLSLVQINYLER